LTEVLLCLHQGPNNTTLSGPDLSGLNPVNKLLVRVNVVVPGVTDHPLEEVDDPLDKILRLTANLPHVAVNQDALRHSIRQHLGNRLFLLYDSILRNLLACLWVFSGGVGADRPLGICLVGPGLSVLTGKSFEQAELFCCEQVHGTQRMNKFVVHDHCCRLFKRHALINTLFNAV